MDSVVLFTKLLDLLIIILGIAALFAVPLRGHFFHDSDTRRKLLHVEIMTLVMVAISIFGLVR